MFSITVVVSLIMGCIGHNWHREQGQGNTKAALDVAVVEDGDRPTPEVKQLQDEVQWLRQQLEDVTLQPPSEIGSSLT